MSVGESLASARVERGLSVDDVSRSTRIRGTVIRAIENDDFDACGGAVYARGHVRSIAHVVGIDPEPLVAEFDRDHGGPPVAPAPTHVFDPEVMAATERRRPNWGAAMAVALVVISVLAAAQLFTGGGSGSKRPSGAGIAQSLAPQQTTSPTPARSRTSPPSAVAHLPVDKGVTVLLRITGNASWCSVKNSAGAVLFEGTLTKGQQKVFKDDKQVKLVLGNAGAVDLVVNGRELGAPGGDGVVARVAFGPGDPGGSGSG
jgi:cytoskeleton protein RodZ